MTDKLRNFDVSLEYVGAKYAFEKIFQKFESSLCHNTKRSERLSSGK